MDNSIVRLATLCLALAPALALGLALPVTGCGGASSDSDSGAIAECDAALGEIESACSDAGLSDVAKKACENAKKSIKTLSETGLKTGKPEIAADGCRKQVDGIKKITQSKAPSARPAAPDRSASAAPAAGGGGGEQCQKLEAELDAACGDAQRLRGAGKAICGASKKVSETFAKMASKNADAAEQGCEKTLADWAKKGGLKKMVGV